MNQNDLPRFEIRFENWLRWCREGSGEPMERCGSAEGGWDSPQVWDAPEPNMRLLMPVNVPDAVLVNRAYVKMAGEWRRVLKIVYFRPHWRDQWKAQKIGCRVSEIADRALKARLMLRNLLAFSEKRVENPAIRETVRPPVAAFSLEAV